MKNLIKSTTCSFCWFIVAESTVRWFIVKENTAGWLLIWLNSSNEQGALLFRFKFFVCDCLHKFFFFGYIPEPKE
jgi:hypothetical protein